MDRFNDAGASQPAKSSLQKSAIAFCHNLSESECFGEIKYFCQASKMVSSFSCLELCQFVLQFVIAQSWARASEVRKRGGGSDREAERQRDRETQR